MRAKSAVLCHTLPCALGILLFENLLLLLSLNEDSIEPLNGCQGPCWYEIQLCACLRSECCVARSEAVEEAVQQKVHQYRIS